MLNDWTACVLTIPSRDKYLRKLIYSINNIQQRLAIKVLYNCPQTEEIRNLASKLKKDCKDLEILFWDKEAKSNSENVLNGDSFSRKVLFHRQEKYGISQGRNKLLNSVETPLVTFIDDDCTLEGENLFLNLEETLKRTSLGLVGIPTYYHDSTVMFKPRKHTPRQSIEGIVYTNVSGIFAVSYTQLLKDFRGFNERKNRLEWVDFCTKLQRGGYPTGVNMDMGLARHWDVRDTSLKENRHLELLYNLLSTALEFECYGFLNSSRKMWELVLEDGNYQGELFPAQLLIDADKVLPQLFEDKKEIEDYRSFLRNLPFKDIMPYAPLGRDDWLKLIEFSKEKIKRYKEELR